MRKNAVNASLAVAHQPDMLGALKIAFRDLLASRIGVVKARQIHKHNTVRQHVEGAVDAHPADEWPELSVRVLLPAHQVMAHLVAQRKNLVFDNFDQLASGHS